MLELIFTILVLHIIIKNKKNNAPRANSRKIYDRHAKSKIRELEKENQVLKRRLVYLEKTLRKMSNEFKK